MTSTESKCGNVDCKELGRLKCTGCSSISYCGQICQKKDWATHKSLCKSLKSQNLSKVAVPDQSANFKELGEKLEALKSITHKHFVSGDFSSSVQCGKDALLIAKQLPPIAASSEVVQLHLNLSAAFMQMRKIPEALEHSNLSVIEAEHGLVLRPGQPQAIEILSITLGTKAFSLVNANKYDEASEAAERSLFLAEKIYPKNDQRLHKSLRALAVVRDKQSKYDEAEKLFLRAYTILCIAGGPHSNDAQLNIEELCNMMIKKGDLASAEKFARINYKSVKELLEKQQKQIQQEQAQQQPVDERVEIIYSDACARLSMVLRRLDKLNEAEELMLQALSIREEKLVRINPAGIAFTLVQVAALQEVQGKVGPDVENKLMRALDIFGRVKGQNSEEVRNTLNQLRNVRNKRNMDSGGDNSKNINGSVVPSRTGASSSSSSSKDDDDDEEDDGLEYRVSAESKSHNNKGNSNIISTGSRVTTSSSSTNSGSSHPGDARGTASSVVTGSSTTRFHNSDRDELRSLKFEEDDAMGRMMQANTYFEQGRYSCAEVLLAQAHALFLLKNGPEDPATKAAKQNLAVARNNSLNQLWMQVVTSLVLESEEKESNNTATASTTTAIDNNSKDAKAVSNNNDNSKIHSSEDLGSIDAYSQLMKKSNNNSSSNKKLSEVAALEDALFNSSSIAANNSQPGCILC